MQKKQIKTKRQSKKHPKSKGVLLVLKKIFTKQADI